VIQEASLHDTPSGRAPATAGWFILNVRDAAWLTRQGFGSGTRFEGKDAEFSELGINIRVLEPGDTNARYHHETTQEDFLVLAGTCLVLIEGEERELHAWDFVHCPPGTEHVFVGSGAEPCIVLMAGSRRDDVTYTYPVSDVARRHGAGVETETDSPAEAYAGAAPWELARPASWDKLPWAGLR